MDKLRIALVVFMLLSFPGLAGCSFMLSLSGMPSIRGMHETNLTPAADFSLTAHTGQELRLGELQGKVVVLTFMDTDCSADCPTITRKIIETAEQMDYYEEAGRVAFIAITSAPEKDTMERAAQLSHLFGMPKNFYFLTGSRNVVEPVWASYKIKSKQAEPARIVLIDTEGRLRAYLNNAEFKPKDLRHNIRLLLSESNLLQFPLCH